MIFPFFRIKLVIVCAAIFIIGALNLSAQGDQINTAPERLVEAAKNLSRKPTRYEPGYIRLSYPGGDPGMDVGVCTDLIIRAYRSIGIDLQALVHEDMRKNFNAYPSRRIYGLNRPDYNIDHRRVPNLATFFKRNGQQLDTSTEKKYIPTWMPGDIVVYDLFGNGRPSHIGIISNLRGESGLPLLLHHYPPLPSEEDCLDKWKILSHLRYFPIK